MNVPIPEIDCGCMPHIYVNLLVETAGSIASDIEDVPTPFVFDPCVVFKEVPGLVKKAAESTLHPGRGIQRRSPSFRPWSRRSHSSRPFCVHRHPW